MLIYLDDVDANLILQHIGNSCFLNQLDRISQGRVKRIIGSIKTGLEDYANAN